MGEAGFHFPACESPSHDRAMLRPHVRGTPIRHGWLTPLRPPRNSERLTVCVRRSSPQHFLETGSSGQSLRADLMTTLPFEIRCEDVRMLRESGTPFLLLDCREPDEFLTAHIPGATLIPMSEIQDRLGELDAFRDSRIVVHCHHGGRSLRVARWLLGLGYPQVQSMAGGIDAWSQRIDPSIPRY